MTQKHQDQQLPVSISTRMVLCGGLVVVGCGIIASNSLFDVIPFWLADPVLILLSGLIAEIVLVSLIDHCLEQ